MVTITLISTITVTNNILKRVFFDIPLILLRGKAYFSIKKKGYFSGIPPFFLTPLIFVQFGPNILKEANFSSVRQFS